MMEKERKQKVDQGNMGRVDGEEGWGGREGRITIKRTA